jgi:hypothetical protein
MAMTLPDNPLIPKHPEAKFHGTMASGSLTCFCDACLEVRCKAQDGIFMRRYVNVGGSCMDVEFSTRPCYLADVKDW